MAREGQKSKKRISTKKGMEPNSIRTQKRKNRNFQSLEQSCRKHRRAIRRSLEVCTISGTTHPIGTKVLPTLSYQGGNKLKVFLATAGGSIKFYNS